MCPPSSKLTDPATIQGTQSKSEPCVFIWITIRTRTAWISLCGCVSIVCVKEQCQRNSGTLTDIPFLHAGSQWEYRRQVGVHGQSGNRVTRIPFVPDGCCWTLGDRSYCECRVVVFPFCTLWWNKKEYLLIRASLFLHAGCDWREAVCCGASW